MELQDRLLSIENWFTLETMVFMVFNPTLISFEERSQLWILTNWKVIIWWIRFLKHVALVFGKEKRLSIEMKCTIYLVFVILLTFYNDFYHLKNIDVMSVFCFCSWIPIGECLIFGNAPWLINFLSAQNKRIYFWQEHLVYKYGRNIKCHHLKSKHI